MWFHRRRLKMIKTIPKKKIYTCDMCKKEYTDFEVFHLLKYKMWLPFLHRKIDAPSRHIMICTKCYMNIEENLRKLSKES